MNQTQYKRLGNMMEDKSSKTARRWNEVCSRCGLPCKNTGTTWIDGSRICQWCKHVLVEDTEYLQTLAQAFHERQLTNDQLVELLSRHDFKIYPLIKRNDKNGRDGN